jgi:hypothetical protein
MWNIRRETVQYKMEDDSDTKREKQRLCRFLKEKEKERSRDRRERTSCWMRRRDSSEGKHGVYLSG